MTRTASKPFTGKHMALVLVLGFGIVVAVNFYMASLAIGGFQGLVVKNSYVASQHFNDWLAEAEAERQLGWQAVPSRDADGHVSLSTRDVPQGAVITAIVRRPIGEHQHANLEFEQTGDGTFRSSEPVDDGRWIIRVTIAADGHNWATEREL